MIHVSIPGAARALVLLLPTAATAVGLGACEPSGLEPPPGPMDVDTYASVMSELVHVDRFPPPGPDYVTREARADSLRREILARYGVTTDEMLEYAESAGQQPALMLEISDRIVVITDSLARLRRQGAPADTARAGGAGDVAAVEVPAPGDTAAVDTAVPTVTPTDTARRPRPLRKPDGTRVLRTPRTTPTPPTPTP